MNDYSSGLGTLSGYSGYGAEQGMAKLREAIATKMYSGLRKPTEIFVSDGSKCDIGRLQVRYLSMQLIQMIL
jgi:LL-diaminopimelate aminotransferase